MVRFPRNWPAGTFHPPAAKRGTNKLMWVPGWRGTSARPITRTSVGRYTTRLSSIPLSGGQVLGIVPASGAITLSDGPQGLGVVWYPVQVNASTTTGLTTAGDNSVCNIYLGPAVNPTTLVGTIYNGNGTAALAIPDMTPGQFLVMVWSGANPGDQAAANVIGTMDALTTG
jgi:hypothetical protein